MRTPRNAGAPLLQLSPSLLNRWIFLPVESTTSASGCNLRASAERPRSRAPAWAGHSLRQATCKLECPHVVASRPREDEIRTSCLRVLDASNAPSSEVHEN